MTNRLAAARNGFLVAVMFALAFWTSHAVPSGGQVATHWGPDNRPDAWVGGSAIQLVNPIIALVIWFLLSTVPQAFSSPEKSLQTVHARFSGMFLAQLVIQLLIAVDVLGLSVF